MSTLWLKRVSWNRHSLNTSRKATSFLLWYQESFLFVTVLKLPSAGGGADDRRRSPLSHSKLLFQTFSANTSSIKDSIFIVIYKSNNSIMALTELLRHFLFRTRSNYYKCLQKLKSCPQTFFWPRPWSYYHNFCSNCVSYNLVVKHVIH